MKNLKAKRLELITELEGLATAIETEVRALTDVEETRAKEIKAELEKIDNSIALVEEQRAKENGQEKQLEEKRSADELEKRALDSFFRGNDLNPEERAMLTTQSGNQATIPVTIAKGILKRLEEMSVILEKSKRFSSKGTLRLINETTYGSAGVTAEGTDFVYDDATLGFIELTAHKISAQTKVSFELLANSEVDLNSYLTDVIIRRLATEVNKFLIAGTGTGQPSGIINGTQICEISEKLDIQDFIMMQTTCNPEYLDKAMWLMNRQTFQFVASNLIDGMGRPMLTTHVINDKVEYRLLGLPVEVDMHMPSMAVNSKAVVLANCQEGYSVNMLQNVTLRHLTEIGFTEGTETFAGYLMLDGAITNQDAIVVGKIVTSTSSAGKVTKK